MNIRINPILSNGFSLVEMAIVLMIVALLMGGLLPSLSGQIEKGKRTETRKALDEIQQALIGFSIINGRLPCPTTETDPTDAAFGLEDGNCSSAAPTAEGFLPWKTLGVAETDAWGIKRTDAASLLWQGYWRYRVDRNFANSGVPITFSTSFSADKLSIVDNSGNLVSPSPGGCTGANPSECPIAVFFSTGPDRLGNVQNASPNIEVPGVFQSDAPSPDFDDMTIWISRPTLFSRMVAAGKLP